MPLEGLQLSHYRLIRLVGSGGMGEVYLAEDPRIHRQVAIKVIHVEISAYAGSSEQENAVRLFQREAKAIAILDHPHILPLYDYGEQVVNGTQFTYLVMPFRPEGSLTNWLHQHSHSQLLSSADVVHFIQQAAGALQYAHNRQIVHQDVKPSNFLIRNNPDAPNRPDLLLTDFGVAKLSTATSSVSHSIRGTPTYMAPEQWSGDPVPATDQYALAIMAYELLVGRPPFQGPPMRMMYLHANTQAQPPTTLNPQLPADVDIVLLQALAKQPQARFASISAFANAFRLALQDTDVPTLISQVAVTDSKDLQATLAINQAEAISGTQRTLTLPNGRRIQVSVPANVYDGQILRLDLSSGSVSSTDSSPGVLVLKLAVKQTAEPITPFIGIAGASNPQLPTVPVSSPYLPTIPASNLQLHDTQLAGSRPDLIATPVTPPPLGVQTQPPDKRGSSVNLKGITLVALALLVLFGSAGFFFYVTRQNQPEAAGLNNNAAATALANAANITTTAQANALATASASGAATQQANAQATQNANGVATAQANATTTAQANTGSQTSSDPYPPYTGTLALTDPLSDNNQGNDWKTYSDVLSSCEFVNGYFQIVETKAGYYADCQSTPYFSNFAAQVQMQIVQGDCGGMVFRANSTIVQFYLFRICQDGSYALLNYVDNTNANAITLASGNSPYIQTGNGASNTIAVVANGDQISLYVNNQYVAATVDSSYSEGHLALFAQSKGNTTEVDFSDLKVWNL
jgi:eukaryotic-like serine/threonine-protein kinase